MTTPILQNIVSAIDLGDGSYEATVNLDFGSGPVESIFVARPADSSPIAQQILAAISAGNVVPTQPPAPPVSPPPAKAALLAYLDSKLNAVCSGEITVNVAPQGQDPINAVAWVSTEGRADLMGQFILAQSTGAQSVTWYQSSGNLTLTLAQLILIGQAVGAFRSSAVDIYSQLAAGIEAGTVTATAQIDAAAWPAG